MANYLFIESQDPFEDRGAQDYLGYALNLARTRERVTVFFVENGVNGVRINASVPLRDQLLAAGAALRAEDFSLRERGIATDRLTPGVSVSGAAHLAELLADPETQAIWH
jgi:predicted peroxiredoxin